MSVRELVKDLLRYFPSQIVPALIAFVSIPLLTNLFPPNEYGDYRLVLATIALVSPIAGWLTTANLRFYPESEHNHELDNLYASNFWLLLVSVGAAGALWGGALLLLHGSMRLELTQMFVIGLVLLLVNVTFSITGSLVRSRRAVSWYSVGAVGRSVLNLGLGLLLVFTVSRSLSAYLMGMVLAGMLVIPLFWWQGTRRVTYALRDMVDWKLAGSMFRYAFPLLFASSAAWLLRLSDRYILAAFRGTTEVGIYAASYGLADSSVGVVLTMIQLPFVVLGNQVFERRGDEEAASFLAKAARIYLLVAIPAAAGVTALGKPLVDALTGQGYAEGYRILPFVTAASVLAGLSFWMETPFIFRKRTVLTLFGIGAGAIVNVGLNILLIPRYGYMAAAVTTLLGYLTLDVVAFVVSRRILKWRLPLDTLAKTALVSLVMAGIVSGFVRVSPFPTGVTIVIGMAIGAVVVGVGLVAMREVSRKELGELRALLAGSIRGRLD
ncbi:MAG: polysaccharide biosynthesis C-terminal domain-containing protein [Acidimicrobiia bacterium]